MNFVSQKFRQSIKLVTVTSLSVLMSASMPLAIFAQEGVIARENRVAQTQTAKSAEATQKKDADKVESKAEEKAAPANETATSNATPGTVKSEPSGKTDQNQNPITQPLALSPEIGT